MGANIFLENIAVAYLGVLGLLIGSFLNVCIYRIPEKKTVAKGRSMCMSCGHTLTALDLVPLFSWIFLRGKCRYCKASVSSRYAKIEALTAFVFALIGFFRKDWIFASSGLLNFVTGITKLLLLLIFASILIVYMMIQKDHQMSPRGIFVGISGIAIVRFFLLFIESDVAMDVLISSVMASAACIVALIFSIWLSPEKFCTRIYWGALIHFEAFFEYFSSEQKALRLSDGVHVLSCLAIGILPALPGIIVYALVRILVPWEKALPFLGIITAASVLVGILMPVWGVFA